METVLVVLNLCNDGLIGTGPFSGHTGLWRQSPGNLAFYPSFQGSWTTSIASLNRTNSSQTSASPALRLPTFSRECRQLHISVIPAEAGIQNPHQQCGIRSQIYPDPDSRRNDGRFDDTA